MSSRKTGNISCLLLPGITLFTVKKGHFLLINLLNIYVLPFSLLSIYVLLSLILWLNAFVYFFANFSIFMLFKTNNCFITFYVLLPVIIFFNSGRTFDSRNLGGYLVISNLGNVLVIWNIWWNIFTRSLGSNTWNLR